MGVGINSEAMWPGDLAGTPFRGIGISEESEEKIHKAGTPSWTIEKGLWKVNNVLDSWFYICSNLVHDLFLLIPSIFCEYELLLTAAC